jgi:redox-sensitive bicupin YhaK (pirin superfamily)
MANTSSRTLRLLSLLQTRRYWPGPVLAERLAVSPRTLRRGDAYTATVYTPIVGSEIRVAPGSRVTLPLHAEWEYALGGIDGEVEVEAGDEPVALEPQHLLYLGVRREGITVSSGAGATVFLLGGAPFEDDIVMWWNFVARTHDEIVEAREEWEAGTARFGHVIGHGDERIPAPPLPGVRLTQRRRRV